MRRPLAVAALALLPGCPGSLRDPERFNAPCPADVPAQILVPSCAGASCHSATAHAAALDLESPGLPARLVGVHATGGDGLLVDPANPDGSVLVRKLTPTPPFGAQQPPGAPLDPATVDCIRVWVRAIISGVGDGGTGGDLGPSGDLAP